MTGHAAKLVLAAAAAAALAPASPAGAKSLPLRTLRVALGINGTEADGGATRPTISDDGQRVAFDSTASNMTLDLNGHQRDVFMRDLDGNRVALVSAAITGGADGPSRDATISGDGSAIVFDSQATNLVQGDTNGLQDVFLRRQFGPVAPVSVSFTGGPADGASSQPDVSGDGQIVVFTSAADNLVQGDTNGRSDVFARNMRTGVTLRVSEEAGIEGDGPSSAPAISPDGRFVSFFSRASNFASDDVNDTGDVFLADLDTGQIERVTVSTSNGQQNRAVVAPFEQVSDVSRGGRFVVFDSDATNLVAKDRNKDTDVFVRDMRSGVTTRASFGFFGGDADNDSFYPRISPDGRFVTFNSFANNLVPGDKRPEDVFVADLKLRANTLVDVKAKGGQRGREHVRQLLQRPAISADAQQVAFISTSPLSNREKGINQDVYVRLTAAPRARLRVTGSRYRASADDPEANLFRCQVGKLIVYCPRSRVLPPNLRRPFTLQVRATGLGMLMGPPARRRVTR